MEKNKSIKKFFAALLIFCCMAGCGKSQDSSLINGLDFFARDEYDSALAVFSKIVKEDPKNSRAFFYRALTYIKQRDDEKAIPDFERVYDIDKNFRLKPEYFLSFAEYNYSTKRDYKKTIELLNIFIEKYPKSDGVIRAHIEIADSFSLMKDFDNAIKAYKNIVDKFGKSTNKIEKRAVELANDGVNFLVENSDYDRKPLFLYADMNNQRDPLKKLEIARQILEQYPNCNLADDVQFKIARIYSVDGLNDFDGAEREYEKLIKTYPKSKFVEAAKNSIMGIDEKLDRKTGKLQGKMH